MRQTTLPFVGRQATSACRPPGWARFWEWLEGLNIRPNVRKLLIALRSYQGRHRWAWPSRISLARELGCCVQTISNLIGRAVSAGLLVVKYRYLRTSLYRCNVPELVLVEHQDNRARWGNMREIDIRNPIRRDRLRAALVASGAWPDSDDAKLRFHAAAEYAMRRAKRNVAGLFRVLIERPKFKLADWYVRTASRYMAFCSAPTSGGTVNQQVRRLLALKGRDAKRHPAGGSRQDAVARFAGYRNRNTKHQLAEKETPLATGHAKQADDASTGGGDRAPPEEDVPGGATCR